MACSYRTFSRPFSGVRRVNEFYTEPEEEGKNDELIAAEIIPERSAVRLSFNNVSFQYETGTNVLQNIDLNLKPLEKITFMGRTGVGKSTLFKLVMGLLQPVEGVITLNGIDVYAIPNSEKRKIFGYVDQSFHLIKGTVAEQISLQDEGITRKKLRKPWSM